MRQVEASEAIGYMGASCESSFYARRRSSWSLSGKRAVGLQLCLCVEGSQLRVAVQSFWLWLAHKSRGDALLTPVERASGHAQPRDLHRAHFTSGGQA